MRLLKQWLSVLSINSIFLLNLGFPLSTLPTTLHRGEVIAQTDPNAEAERLFNQGRELFRQGTVESKKQAIVVLEKALQLSQQAENLEGQAASLLFLGRIYSDLGDKQLALKYYNQSLPLWRQVGDKAGVAITLNNIGGVYNALGDKEQALLYYNQSLPLSQQLGNTAVVAATLNNIGGVYSDLGDKQLALLYYNQSLPLSRQVGDIAGEATTLTGIGAVYSDLGDKQTALEFFNQSLPLWRQVGDKAGEAATLNHIGKVYSDLGDKQTALKYFNQSLPLRRQVGDKAGEAVTLNNIGKVYSDLGDKQQALSYYNQSLPLSRQVRNQTQEAGTLNNIGLVYDALGDKQQALSYYNQSLPLSRQVGNKAAVAATLNNIGRVYYALGDKQQALDYYNQSLTLSRLVEDKAAEATTLNNIGGVYDALGDKQQALSYYNQSLPLSRQVGNKAAVAATLNNIGGVYYELGEKQKALEYYNLSLPLTRQVGDKAQESITLYNFASIKRSQGNLTEALADIESAINIIEELRTKIISQDLRTTYFSTVYGYYQFYIDLLMELHEQNPNQGYDAKALHASERGRARSLLDILAESGANIKEGVDPQLLAEEQKLLQRLNTLDQCLQRNTNKLDQCRQLNSGQIDFDKLKQEIETVRQELQALEVEIKRSSPQYAKLKYPEPLTASEIQQQVLDEETVLLVYSLGRERSFLWLVSSTEVKTYQLPKREEIEQLSQDFLAEIESKAVVPESGEKLSQVLLSPVLNQLGNERLVIVGDGILQTVPFAALPLTSEREGSQKKNNSSPLFGGTEGGQKINSSLLSIATEGSQNRNFTSPPAPLLKGEGSQKINSSSLLSVATEGSQKINNSSLLLEGTEGGQKPNYSLLSVATEGGYTPLIVQHEIITLPSASSLAILREQVQGRTPAPKKVAIIADPVFEESDPRFQGDYQTTTDTRKNDVNYIALRQSTEDFLGKSMSRLEYSRQEAEGILALVPDTLEQLSLDFNATHQAATDSSLSQYQIVHFATHGLLNETQPELSGLVFSLYDQQGTEKPGFLQLNDIFNLTLSADLVVLSACETGIGQEIRGEGLVSLTRGFMYAGAERVVVSLWAVADLSTSEFMQNYYRKILETGSNQATALRETQLEMLQSNQYNAPYFWAAFVFQGEWKDRSS